MATEASCERVFSIASYLMPKERARLDESIFDLHVCIRVNQKLLDDRASVLRYLRRRINQIKQDSSQASIIPASFDSFPVTLAGHVLSLFFGIILGLRGSLVYSFSGDD